MISYVTDRDRRALPDILAESLLSAVKQGQLKPGEQLPREAELAKQLGVGRTSLREAIQRLRAMGVLEVRSGLGTFVVDDTRMEPVHSFVKWSVDNEFEVIELFEARMALEIAAAGLAAERASAAEWADLEKASQKHRAASGIEALVHTDEQFHELLVACGHNSLISKLYSMLVPRLREFRTVSLAIPASAGRSSDTHDALVSAIVARDPAGSRRAMVTHLWQLYSSVTNAANTTATKEKARRQIADKRVWIDD